MSDQKLRELERRWKESGSPDDEAAYLRERVRVGDLTRERLELAAYCGHEGAAEITGVKQGPDCERGLEDWVLGAAAFGPWCSGAIALVAAQSVLGIWESGSPDDTRPQRALEVLASALNGVLDRAALEAAWAEVTAAADPYYNGNQVEARLGHGAAGEAAADAVQALIGVDHETRAQHAWCAVNNAAVALGVLDSPHESAWGRRLRSEVQDLALGAQGGGPDGALRKGPSRIRKEA